MTAGRIGALVFSLLLTACGGDDSSPAKASGGSAGTATGGTGGTGGTTTTGGGGSGGTVAGGGTGTGATGGGGAPSGCVPKATGWVADLGSYPEGSPPALPNAGSSAQDPSFGTTIVRITDSSDGDDCKNAYSYWPTFDATSTHLFVNCANGSSLYDFDPKNGTASNKRKLFANATASGTTPGWEDAIWSLTNPNILYAHDGTRVWKYDVVSEGYELVKDFSTVLGSGHVKQMSKSANDDVFGFSTQDAAYNVLGALAYRASDDKVLIQVDQAGLDEVQVDKSGKWLVIKTGNSGSGAIEVRVANLDTQAIEDLIDDAPDFSPGHSDNGNGIVLGADNWQNRVTARKLDAPHQVTAALELKNDWNQDYHVSMHADDEAWVLLSLYQSGAHTDGLFHDEIIQVSTDGSQTVRRLAHHRSQVGDYWDSPRANISRDGCFVAFTSTWGASGRRDVFVLDLSK